jgi:hypothetical protein
MIGTPLSKSDITHLLTRLNEDLRRTNVRGELYLVGGAVMCLVHEARDATKDVDAFFRPAAELRAAAARVALETGVPEGWLNDAVKGFFSERGDFSEYLQLSHLTVFAADPAYLLAMKCLSARIGEEFHDVDDIRFLLRSLNIASMDGALTVMEKYYPLDRFPQKSMYLLEGLLQSV